MREELLER
jgi:hypothetical protein